jgi:predicted ATP-grasp superfamily ATP-dependent carboligase
MLDKERTYSLARSLGVPAPRTVTVRTARDVERAKTELGFPCALKPLQSHKFAQYFPTTKALVVHDGDELDTRLADLVGLGLEMLVTEIVSGADGRYVSYYTYLDQNGEPLLHFCKHKIRQFPTGFGLASFQVSKWDPQVAELGLRFCQGVGLRGLAAVEFKYDSHNRPMLIECNHRFTAANELVRMSGIDLGLFTYARLTGHPYPPVGGFKEGVYMWNPIQDMRALMSYRRGGELSFLAWARSLVRPSHFPVARWYDPMPTVGYHWYWMLRGWRKWGLRTGPLSRPA